MLGILKEVVRDDEIGDGSITIAMTRLSGAFSRDDLKGFKAQSLPSMCAWNESSFCPLSNNVLIICMLMNEESDVEEIQSDTNNCSVGHDRAARPMRVG